MGFVIFSKQCFEITTSLSDNNPDTKNFPTVHTEVTGHIKITFSLKDTEINLKTKEKATVKHCIHI